MRRVSAMIIGCLFVLSGVLKLMDPVGSSLLMESYFGFLHLSFLRPAGPLMGVLFPLFESVLGAALVTGVFKRHIGIISGAVLAFFTVLTAVMWVCDAPMDCGCFGEAVHLSHLQSLVKNILLMALWAAAFLPFNVRNGCRKVKYATFSAVSLSLCAFAVYSIVSVPLMDFTPFAPGAEIFNPETSENMDAPVLTFCDAEGEYADSLALGQRVLAVSFYKNTPELDPKSISCLEEAVQAGIQPLLLSSNDMDAPLPVYRADSRMLMTLNRSNGGATYIADGQIIAKWPRRSLPDSEAFAELSSTPADESLIDENTPKRLKLQGFLLYVYAVLLLV